MSSAPFLSQLVPTQPGTRMTVEQTVSVIHEEVAIRPRTRQVDGNTSNSAPAHATAYLASAEWGPEELRSYVVDMIEKTVGPTPRQPEYKERAIFTGFVKRHGARRAAQIARYAFEQCGGYWKNAPVSVNRFCQNSDPYFSYPISQHLDQVDAARA